MSDERERNLALLVYVLLPTIFLAVALLGGVRVAATGGAFSFIPPPLVTLVLASMLLVLFARGGAVLMGRWLSADNAPLRNVSHALTLGALFFASAQSFNSVLPERGLLRWVFSFFFLWTLWQNLFVPFDARRLLRSLAVLFGTAFVLKHMLLASLFTPDGGWLRRLSGALLEGFSLGALTAEPYAPATGYVSFFALALYVLGLFLLPPAPDDAPAPAPARAEEFVAALNRLAPGERAAVLDALDSQARGPALLESTIEGDEEESERTHVTGRTPPV
ncbi:MAG TPA: hypothetical protein VEY09_14315 [Pyrinomonadaceae bacterium]|nr:hypothetical protein [Pyrinomonadaceae bacterium]